MLGFIKKDMAMIKSNFKILFILFIFYGVMTFNDGMDISFILPFICVMIMISTFSYDEYNNWNAYTIALPNGRENSVKAKYLATLLMIAITSIITIMLSLIIILIKKQPIELEEILVTTLGSIFGTLLVLSIMYPIIYKFGIEKARIAIFVIVIATVFAASFLFSNIDLSFIGKTLNFLEDYIVLIIIAISILMVYISYHVSKKIYLNKEF